MGPTQLSDSLHQRPELRKAWLERLRIHIESDSRIAALWLVGSLASDQSDNWSDIDLILYCDAQVIDGRQSLARAIGKVILEWDAPQNAAAGSMHYCTVYDLGPLPFGVDWHLWTKGSLRPSDAKPVVAGGITEASSLTFEELQKKAADENRNRHLPEMSRDERRQFRLSMLYPICKDLARGWPQSSAMMVEWLGFPPPDSTLDGWVRALQEMLDELSEDFAAGVHDKYQNLLRITEMIVRESQA